MAKKLFNSNARVDTILEYRKDIVENRKLSAFISDAITNYILPQYGTLHTEALYLLDTVADDLNDWKGPGGSRIVPDEPSAAAYTAVRRAVSWLRENHIKNDAAIKAILSHYDMSHGNIRYTGADHVMISRMTTYAFKLGMSVEETTSAPDMDFGALVQTLVDSWASVWDDPDAYEILIRFIHVNGPSVPFDPFEAIEIMRMIEQTYIIEHISE